MYSVLFSFSKPLRSSEPPLHLLRTWEAWTTARCPVCRWSGSFSLLLHLEVRC